VTRNKSTSDKNLLPLAITSLVACALAGVAVLVSANTQVHTYPNSNGIEKASSLSALQAELKADKLKHNAFAAFQNLPDYNVQLSPKVSNSLSIAISSEAISPSAAVNVNTFLLATRISNESQLAELQMQPFFGDVDVQQFAKPRIDTTAGTEVVLSASYAGVGFPHIETNDRADSAQYKPYKELMSISANAHGGMVPNVKCMGLSAERVAKRAKKYDAKIFELAIKHRVSANLVKAVVAKESCYDPKARSYVGAIGLMQLMPETAQWLKVSKPENVNQNLSAGVRYLAQLRKRFGSNELALAAYNAGPGNVERYKGIPPFAETQNYVQDVMYFYRGYVATTRFVNAMSNYE